MNINSVLQLITLAVLIGIGSYLIVDNKYRENQILIWLEDAEQERLNMSQRIKSIETHLIKTDPNYVQTD